MAKRGDNFRREIKLRIVSLLLDRKSASASALANGLGVSRVTLSLLLEELVDEGLLCREEGERAYSFADGVEALFLKMGRSSAEIVCFSLADREINRTSLPLIPSMSYYDNAARLIGIAELYLRERSSLGKRMVPALIYGGGALDIGVPKDFTALDTREMIALGIEEKYGSDGAVLYIDATDGASYLLRAGEAILSGSCVDISEKELCSAFKIMTPDRVVLVGTDEGTRRSTERAAAKCRAQFCALDSEALRPDERAALLGIIEKKI